MKKIIFSFVLFSLFIYARAQEFEGISRGDKEISFNGMVTVIQDNTIGNIFFSYGRYVTKRLEIGLAPGLTISQDMTDLSGQLFVNYNFSNKRRVFPYLKASYYQQSFDTDGDFFAFGFIQGGPGLKAFFNSRVAWDTSLTFGIPASSEGSGSGILMLLTGISVKW